MSEIRVTVHLGQSPLDARRGIARLHPLALQALGLRPWDAVTIEGARTTGAAAALSAPGVDPGIVVLDELISSNAGVSTGQAVSIRRAAPAPAVSISLADLPPSGHPIDAGALRFALLGKIVAAGDRVSLLPQDMYHPAGEDTEASFQQAAQIFTQAWGGEWKAALPTIAGTDPPGLVTVTMETRVDWGSDVATSSSSAVEGPAPAAGDLPGHEEEIGTLREIIDLGLNHSHLLERLGGAHNMGVLVTGPPGSGKVSIVRAVAASTGAEVLRLWGPSLASQDPGRSAAELSEALTQAQLRSPSILLIEDVDAIASKEDASPLLPVLVETIEKAAASGKAAVVCTTSHPEATHPSLRLPGALEREIPVSLPQRDERRRMLEVHTHGLPLDQNVVLDQIAGRTPGYVAADIALLCREAGLRAAQRAVTVGTSDPAQLLVVQQDLEDALEVVRPSAIGAASVELADVRFSDVGNMETTKEQLAEAIIWPLRYPDSFERLGIDPPRGILLYGPPGCGKTFLVKALANESGANFLSVKGAELLSKWVGESERAVVELFRKARHLAPAIVLFDEIDALAPPRGKGNDSGTTDRVVAQLLTELDGVEDLRDVSVIAATNRPDLVDPALLRPGRLERIVYVPPPELEARAKILEAATKGMPCEDVDLHAVARATERYSAADLAAVARTAALNAMRSDIEAAVITSEHFERALGTVRPSIAPEVVAGLENFARKRAAGA